MKLSLFLFILLFTQSTIAQKDEILQDIYSETKRDRITFGNSKVRLDFRKDNGMWIGLRNANDTLLNNIHTVHFEDTFDFVVNSKPVIKDNVLKYKKGFFEAKNDYVLLTFIYEVVSADNLSIDVQLFYKLYPHSERIERSAAIRRIAGMQMQQRNPKFESFSFKIPTVKIGNTSECVINTPGPFFIKTLIKPNTPYDSLKTKTIKFHQAPDAGFGLLTVVNPFRKKGVATWLETHGETSYDPVIIGEKTGLSFLLSENKGYFLKPDKGIESAVQVIYLNENLDGLLAGYQKSMTKTLPLDPRTPDWVKNATILEVYPKFFRNGFKDITAKLPYYQQIGFNTIYLMPHWVGGYMPLDPFKIDPTMGTEDDLKQLVAKAHQLGMKVLFDMVIHGFSEKSDYVLSHAQMFVHNEDGTLAKHRTWKSISTDWGSPKYQAFMIGLVLHDLATYNIDGYRVDAASFKGPGWDYGSDNPAYKSGSDALILLKQMLTAMRQKKSDVVLLNEVFGPAFLHISNFGHDNQTESPTQILELLSKRQYTAADYKKYLAGVYKSLPEGINRVFFARNHDTSWFYKFNGYTAQYYAFDAIHSFFGIPEVFAGDPDNEPIPRDYVMKNYQKIFATRNLHSELKTGKIDFDNIVPNNPNVFTGLRTKDKKAVAVVISLSNQTEETTIDYKSDFGPIKLFTDVLTGQTVKLKKGKMTLQPYQILVGRN